MPANSCFNYFYGTCAFTKEKTKGHFGPLAANFTGILWAFQGHFPLKLLLISYPDRYTHRTRVQTDLSQIASLAVLHGQKWQVVGGHQPPHPLRNLPSCDHVNMIQPERGNRTKEATIFGLRQGEAKFMSCSIFQTPQSHKVLCISDKIKAHKKPHNFITPSKNILVKL